MKSKKIHLNRLFKILNINNYDDLKRIAKILKVSSKDLEFYNNNMIFPSDSLKEKILNYTGYTELELKLRLGILDNRVVDFLAENPEHILRNIKEGPQQVNERLEIKYQTELGELYQGDCISLMKQMPSNSVELIFADPPFNLNKIYESGIDDRLSEEKYIQWTEEWILECIRILAPGGSLYIYNIPYWATHISNILNKYLNFRHWISISLKGLIPVANKLHPSHYALLYYVKGEKASTFNKQRIPMSTCRHCGGEVHDYGGKKKDLSPEGLSLSDVWVDINPVRHKKFKNRDANELPVKLLHRIISISSNEGDVIFDPFGGSGTTYTVSEYLNRKWIGIEIGEINTIINRIENQVDKEQLMKIDEESNVLFTEAQVNLRKQNNFWSYEILSKKE